MDDIQGLDWKVMKRDFVNELLKRVMVDITDIVKQTEANISIDSFQSGRLAFSRLEEASVNADKIGGKIVKAKGEAIFAVFYKSQQINLKISHLRPGYTPEAQPPLKWHVEEARIEHLLNTSEPTKKCESCGITIPCKYIAPDEYRRFWKLVLAEKKNKTLRIKWGKGISEKSKEDLVAIKENMFQERLGKEGMVIKTPEDLARANVILSETSDIISSFGQRLSDYFESIEIGRLPDKFLVCPKCQKLFGSVETLGELSLQSGFESLAEMDYLRHFRYIPVKIRFDEV